MGLARRRQDTKRMKAKALRVYPHDKQGRSANHLSVCSGACCGNQRHNGWLNSAEKLTMQERRANTG